MEGFHTEQLKVNTLDDPKRWGKPLAALLGANRVQQELVNGSLMKLQERLRFRQNHIMNIQ